MIQFKALSSIPDEGKVNQFVVLMKHTESESTNRNERSASSVGSFRILNSEIKLFKWLMQENVR